MVSSKVTKKPNHMGDYLPNKHEGGHVTVKVQVW